MLVGVLDTLVIFMHYAYTILTLKLYMYVGLSNVSLSATTFFGNDGRPVLVRVEVEVCKNDCYDNKAQFFVHLLHVCRYLSSFVVIKK